MGTGTILKLLAGIGVGMGIRVTGTVGDGYKYLSPCSCLVCSVYVSFLVMLILTDSDCRRRPALIGIMRLWQPATVYCCVYFLCHYLTSQINSLSLSLAMNLYS